MCLRVCWLLFDLFTVNISPAHALLFSTLLVLGRPLPLFADLIMLIRVCPSLGCKVLFRVAQAPNRLFCCSIIVVPHPQVWSQSFYGDMVPFWKCGSSSYRPQEFSPLCVHSFEEAEVPSWQTGILPAAFLFSVEEIIYRQRRQKLMQACQNTCYNANRKIK